jgi:hypothetical protein
LALDVNGFNWQLHMSRFKAGQRVWKLPELLEPGGSQCLIPQTLVMDSPVTCFKPQAASLKLQAASFKLLDD